MIESDLKKLFIHLAIVKPSQIRYKYQNRKAPKPKNKAINDYNYSKVGKKKSFLNLFQL